jgi:hypothetical protein
MPRAETRQGTETRPLTRTNEDLAARLATLEERLAELEREDWVGAVGRAEDAIDRLVGRVLPADARGHLRAARKEQLLAARSFIDHWIERLDRPPAPRRAAGRRAARTPRRRESIILE